MKTTAFFNPPLPETTKLLSAFIRSSKFFRCLILYSPVSSTFPVKVADSTGGGSIRQIESKIKIVKCKKTRLFLIGLVNTISSNLIIKGSPPDSQDPCCYSSVPFCGLKNRFYMLLFHLLQTLIMTHRLL